MDDPAKERALAGLDDTERQAYVDQVESERCNLCVIRIVDPGSGCALGCKIGRNPCYAWLNAWCDRFDDGA